MLFGLWNELFGRDRSAHRMLPTRQCLKTRQLSCPQDDNGLKVRTEFTVGNRAEGFFGTQ